MKNPQTIIQIPEAFQPLFTPKRYKIFYGGRGGAKSHNFARALLILGMQRKLRVLCARELQNSIQDSVHKLLRDIISEHGLDAFYTVTLTGIRGPNGTEFLFKGLKHNSTEIKSTEGIDVCWVEEAEKVSQGSWELLIPTIRKNGSEIWVSFNRKRPTDPTWKMVQSLMGSDDAIIVHVGWQHNPFFPEVLNKERLRLLAADPEAYAHIWEGEFDTRHHGGVYTKWLTKSREAGRVRDGVFDPKLPVHTAWDLGFGDATAIWFWQMAGNEVRCIDYYENSGQDVPHYCDVLKTRGYQYGKHYVPHDAGNKLLAAGGRSVVEQAWALGVKMYVVVATSQPNQIEAARATIGNCWFDKEKCGKALETLEQYQFEYDEDKACFKDKPRHDWTSHCADAFEIIGQVWKEIRAPEPTPQPRFLHDMTANELFWPKTTNNTRERI